MSDLGAQVRKFISSYRVIPADAGKVAKGYQEALRQRNTVRGDAAMAAANDTASGFLGRYYKHIAAALSSVALVSYGAYAAAYGLGIHHYSLYPGHEDHQLHYYIDESRPLGRCLQELEQAVKANDSVLADKKADELREKGNALLQFLEPVKGRLVFSTPYRHVTEKIEAADYYAAHHNLPSHSVGQLDPKQ